MPNIAALLKSEISRLARREIRKEVLPLRKSAASQRREIATLKRTVATLDRRARSLAKMPRQQLDGATISDGQQTRFVAKGLVSLRKRLTLSAADLAHLLGVSMQSVYNWERKKATPRKEQVAAIVALRGLGKKEAQQRLDALRENRAGDRAAKRTSKKRGATRGSAKSKPALRKARRRAK